jgi:hypothetical protein
MATVEECLGLLLQASGIGAERKDDLEAVVKKLTTARELLSQFDDMATEDIRNAGLVKKAHSAALIKVEALRTSVTRMVGSLLEDWDRQADRILEEPVPRTAGRRGQHLRATEAIKEGLGSALAMAEE